jgi:hypothetical protein
MNRGTAVERTRFLLVAGLSTGLFLAHSITLAQVFPPRQPQPAPVPTPIQPGQTPSPAALPQAPVSPPGTLTRSIPLVAILGDPTKSFIQLGNMRSPFDSNFALARGLMGRIMLEKYTYEAGNGQKAFVHVIGMSNPPIVTMEGPEVRYQFVFPTIQFKTYYKDYSGEGDSALNDLVAEKVLVDVFLSPTIDQRRYPTYHSVRIAITGGLKEADKCTYFFDIIFPVNICKVVDEYFRQIQPALENGMREILLQPQTRTQFEHQVAQFIRGDLLTSAGINPMSPAQIEILQAEFRGADYLVGYRPR